jgi:hypothetical protein
MSLARSKVRLSRQQQEVASRFLNRVVRAGKEGHDFVYVSERHRRSRTALNSLPVVTVNPSIDLMQRVEKLLHVEPRPRLEHGREIPDEFFGA